MLKYKTIGLLTFTTINLFALDINEAVDIALKNNFSLKQQQYSVEESKANVVASKSAYLPKVNVGYIYNTRDNLVIMQTDEDSTLSANLSFNLFNGFRDRYNIQGEKDLFNASKFTLKAKKHDLILHVKSTYMKYLLKQKQTQTQREALKLYEKQYLDSKNYFKQGLIAKNELLEVEVVMLQAKQNYQKTKSDQKIAKKELRNTLGGHLSDNEEIKELGIDNQTLSSSDEKLLENRSEIQSLEFIVKNYDNRAKATKGTFLPTVDASLGYNRYGDEVFPNGRENYPKNQTQGTIHLNWNLYNGNKDEATIVKYRKKSDQTKMQLKDLKLQIKLQYEKAKEELNVAKLNLTTATKAQEQAKLNYEIVQNKVKEGISSNSDLIDANYLLTKAKQNYFKAFYDEYLAVASIDRVFEK